MHRNIGLKPRIPEPVENYLDKSKRKEWVEKKDAFTFVSDKSPLQLDIFLSYPKSFEELLKGSEEIIVGDVNMKVSSIDDLLNVKRSIEPLRDKDKTDITELERIKSKKN